MTEDRWHRRIVLSIRVVMVTIGALFAANIFLNACGGPT